MFMFFTAKNMDNNIRLDKEEKHREINKEW